MELKDILKFSKFEHERLLKMYGLKDNKELRHLIALKIMEEIGELSEELLSLDQIQRTEKLAAKKSKIDDELADVIITTLLLAENLGVDIKKAIEDGIDKRLKRKY